jgi:hypothetical protein
MSKMGPHCSFEHLKHKLWPIWRAKSQNGNLTPDQKKLPTGKSQESTQFTCLQTTCNISLESSQRGLQLCFRLHLDPRCVRKVMELQSCGSSNLGDSKLPSGSPETKSHLDVGPMERCRVYYKGEGGGFPQVWAVVSLVCPCCPWLVLAPKVLQLRTNHLVWVLCRPMWVSEACQLFLVPSWSSSTPLYPSKCCELRSVPRLLFFSLFSTWTHIWVFQGVGSASFQVHLMPWIIVSHPPLVVILN